MARVLHVRNVMAPQIGAQAATEAADGLTVSEVIRSQGWRLSPRTVLVRGGELVKRADWDTVPLGANDDALLIAIPAGDQGGSGQQASQILTVLAQIAAVVFLGPIYGTLAAAAIGVAVGVGSALVQSVIFQPKKQAPFEQQGPISPTYSLQAQTNQARIGAAIPEVFGRHKIICDLISQPYTDFASDNEQTIYELFAVGVGDYDIEEIGVAKNPVWDGSPTGSYPGLEFEIVSPGSAVTLFPDNVETSTEVESIELIGSDQPGYDWSGPFVVNGSGTQASQIAVDIALPTGLFKVNESTGALLSATVSFRFEAQEIDDAGAPVGSYATIIDQTLTMSARDATRRTFTATVTPARYRIRGKRTNAKGDPATSDTLYWFGLRAFLPSTRVYGDMTIIAVKAKATDHLNGTTAQQFYAIVTRKLPTYDPDLETWSANTATRRIADAAAYLIRSSNNGGMADSAIDLARLYELQDTWTLRGDHFDGVFDQRQTFWENLYAILRAGRAIPIIAGPVITFVRDEPKTVYRCAFTPRNMLADSFVNDYRVYSGLAPDAVVVDYFDSRDWAARSVFCSFGDSTTTESAAPRISLFGVTERDHAWREGIYALADDRYRRITATFDTELDGRVCFKGDLVKVSHWSAEWGSSFQVIDAVDDGGDDLLTLSDPWTIPAGHELDTLFATITTPDGQIYGPVEFDLVDDGATTRQAQIKLTTTYSVTLGLYAGDVPSDWPVWAGAGLQQERPRAMLGVATMVPQAMLVQSMKPSANGRVTITAVLENALVHAADDDDPPDEDFPPDAPVQADLTITGLTLQLVEQSSSVIVTVTVRGAVDAVSFESRWKWVDAVDYGPTIAVAGRTFFITAEVADLIIQVRAIGKSGVGNWFSAATSANANAAPNLAVLRRAITFLRNVQRLLDQYGEIAITQTYKQEVVLPGLVTGVEASVNREITLRANADSALAQLVEEARAIADDATASALIKWVAAAGPAGVVARLALLSRATLGDAYTEAGIYIDAMIIGGDLQSQITLDADFIWLKTSADRVLLSDGGVTTQMLIDKAATIHEKLQYNGPTTASSAPSSFTTLDSTSFESEGKPICFSGSIGFTNPDNTNHGASWRLTRDGTQIYPPSGLESVNVLANQTWNNAIAFEEIPGAGTYTYAIQWLSAHVNNQAFGVFINIDEIKR